MAGLGDWGIVEGLIYENWEEKAFDIEEIRKLKTVQSAFGLDFGYTNDPSAFFCGLIDDFKGIPHCIHQVVKIINGLIQLLSGLTVNIPYAVRVQGKNEQQRIS